MTNLEMATMRLLAHLFKSSRLWMLGQLIFSVVLIFIIYTDSSSRVEILIISLLIFVLLYYQLRLQLDAAILLDLSAAVIHPQDLDEALYRLKLIKNKKTDRTLEERCDACRSLWKKYLYLSAIHLVLSVWFST